jgi:hypothetical protein
MGHAPWAAPELARQHYPHAGGTLWYQLQRRKPTKKIVGIAAIAVALLSTGQLALAQTTPDMGANTGSEANRAQHQRGGTYTGGGQ